MFQTICKQKRSISNSKILLSKLQIKLFNILFGQIINNSLKEQFSHKQRSKCKLRISNTTVNQKSHYNLKSKEKYLRLRKAFIEHCNGIVFRLSLVCLFVCVILRKDTQSQLKERSFLDTVLINLLYIRCVSETLLLHGKAYGF